TVTRDMLHQKLHRDAIHKTNQISNDPETQTRFLKRAPFQVESCWSRVVVLRSTTALKVSGVSSGSPILFAEILNEQSQMEVEHRVQPNDVCVTADALRDDRALFSRALWTTITTTITTTTTPPSEPGVTAATDTNKDMIRMVVVPSIQFTDSPKEYVLQGLFNGWGLWPKTEKQYRDELENRLISISHRPLYGYRPSTSSYGYTPRVEEENDGGASSSSNLLSLVLNGGSQPDEQNEPEESQEEVERKMKAKKEEERMISEIVPEETVEGLKTRLETIGAVFGVQDIQNAVLAKRDEDLITSWRPQFVIADALDSNVDC
ncbi:hypothetical protein BGX24_006849, partial [Mortierella sp. AD032]